jgi:hypothetical protein
MPQVVEKHAGMPSLPGSLQLRAAPKSASLALFGPQAFGCSLLA